MIRKITRTAMTRPSPCLGVVLFFGCIFAAGALNAADGTKVWTASELKGIDQKMSAKKEKVGTESLGAFNNYNMSVSHRNASGEAELHQRKSDIFYILTGNATLVTGGTIAGQRTTQPHEIRGTAVNGGTRRKIGAGDWITIPVGVPHQMLLEPGAEITYAVVKVEAR